MNYLTNCLPKTSKAVGTSLLLPLHHVLLLPGITMSVIVRKANNIGVAEATLLSPQKQLVIATVRRDVSENVEIQSLEEIYPIATLAVVQRIIRLPAGMQLVVQGLERVCIEQLRVVDRICEIKFSRLPEIISIASVNVTDLSQELEAQPLRGEILRQTRKQLEKTTIRVLFATSVKRNSRGTKGKLTRKLRN